MSSPLEAVLFTFVIATALETALLRDVLAVIIVAAAYSLGMALFYAFLLAPDVAMTEAAIGAGVTTLLLLLTVARTVRTDPDRLFEFDDLGLAAESLAPVDEEGVRATDGLSTGVAEG